MTPAAVERSVLVLLGAVVLSLSIASVRLDSATADEGAHIAAGLVRLQHGDFRFYAGQPPLMNAVLAMPLALSGVRVPETWREGQRTHWRVGHHLLYRSGHDPERILFLARLPAIALLLLLCFAVFWLVLDQTGNRIAALVAFAMTGFCPNLMAHGRLATVDMGATAFTFLSAALFLRLLRRPTKALGAAAGAAAACAILSKTSALLLLVWMALLLAVHLIRVRRWREMVAPMAACVVTFVAVVYATYALLGRDPSPSLAFREYAYAIAEIQQWYTTGHSHPQFLLGEFSRDGWPHYFLVAVLLKTPIAAQLLFIAACVAAVRARSTALLGCIAFVLLYLGVATTSRIALGIRHVLPIFPFFYAAIALALAGTAARKPQRIAAAVLVGWHICANLIAYPSYISYFNELIGSHRNADRLLIDSNLDWGQDLRRLKLWCEERGIDFIRIDYFGGGEPAHTFGDKGERWPAPRPQLLPRGWFAVSRHFYRTSFSRAESPIDYDTYLAASRAEYVDTVGGSIDVYRVR